MVIDTKLYEWFKGKKPNGNGYYSIEIHYNNGENAITYNFKGDFDEILKEIQKEYNNITKIIVGV